MVNAPQAQMLVHRTLAWFLYQMVRTIIDVRQGRGVHDQRSVPRNPYNESLIRRSSMVQSSVSAPLQDLRIPRDQFLVGFIKGAPIFRRRVYDLPTILTYAY